MTVKKQEIPAYDPRAVQGIGLNYATSNRGGCHVRGYTISAEVLGIRSRWTRTRSTASRRWWAVPEPNGGDRLQRGVPVHLFRHRRRRISPR